MLLCSLYWTLPTLSADHYVAARHNTRTKCYGWSNRSRRKHKTFAGAGCPLPFIKLVKWQEIASQLHRQQTLLCVICLHAVTATSGSVKRDTTPASTTKYCILFASIAACLRGSCKNSYRCWFKLHVIPRVTIFLENLIFVELRLFPAFVPAFLNACWWPKVNQTSPLHGSLFKIHLDTEDFIEANLFLSGILMRFF